MLLGQLAASDEALRLVGDPSTPIDGLSYDVRSVRAGDLFAALDGEAFRGHGVAGEAAARGAAALLIARDVGVDLPALVGPEPRTVLPHIAATFHGHPSATLDVIGVTGTDGKTTTTHLIESVLRASGLLTGSISTVGVRIGDAFTDAETRLTTPEAPDVQAYLSAMVDAGVRWAVIEATSHGLALNRLDDVRFAAGAVTNVTHEHLDFHGTPDGYLRAKASLLERVKTTGGVGVVNADDPGAMAALELVTPLRTILFGLEASADVGALDLRPIEEGSTFVLVTPGGRARVRLPLAGRFNVANALCAAACAHAAGLAPDAIAEGLESAAPVPGRLTSIDAGQPFTVVVDYAHSPAAVAQVLELLRDRCRHGRLIAVLGSAGQRDFLKRPWLGEVAAKLADYSVFTSEDPRLEDPEAIVAQIAVGAVSAGGRETETFACIADRLEAVRHALDTAHAGDCVVLLGKGHERSIVWGGEEREWDEAAVARAVLGELGYAG